MKYLQTYNESIKNVLKPKSPEFIQNNLNKLYGVKKIKYVEKYDLYNYVTVDEIKQIIISELDLEEILDVLTYYKIKNLFSVYELNEIKENILQMFFEQDLDYRQNFLNLLYDYNLFNMNELNELQQYCQQNESIKNILKPKSPEYIKSIVDNMNNYDKLRYIKKYKLNNIFSDEEIKDLLLNNNYAVEELIDLLCHEPFYNLLTDEEINDIKNDFRDIVLDIDNPGEQLSIIEDYDKLGFFTQKERNEILKRFEKNLDNYWDD